MVKKDQDPIYTKQCRDTTRSFIGETLEGKLVVEIGRPVDARFNAPELVPVRFLDGTYGVIWDTVNCLMLHSDNPKVNRAIKYSTKMPLVSPGHGSGVMWITVYPDKDIAYAGIKVYYNDKADRSDSYKEVSWMQAFKARRERAELRRQQEAKQPALAEPVEESDSLLQIIYDNKD